MNKNLKKFSVDSDIKKAETIPSYFYKEHMKKIISDEDKPRAVCDFIAGMTDNYAQNFYNKFN